MALVGKTAPVLLNTEHGDKLEDPHDRHQNNSKEEIAFPRTHAENTRHLGIEHHHGKHTHVGADAGHCSHLLPDLLLLGDRRHQRPVGQVVRGIGHTPEQVYHRRKGHVGAALQTGVGEHEHRQNAGGEHSKQDPGLEFAPAGAGIVHNGPHDGVVEGVKHPEHHHQPAQDGKIPVRQAHHLREIGDEIHTHQGVHGIAAHGTKAKAVRISLHRLIHVQPSTRRNSQGFRLPRVTDR